MNLAAGLAAGLGRRSFEVEMLLDVASPEDSHIIRHWRHRRSRLKSTS